MFGTLSPPLPPDATLPPDEGAPPVAPFEPPVAAPPTPLDSPALATQTFQKALATASSLGTVFFFDD